MKKSAYLAALCAAAAAFGFAPAQADSFMPPSVSSTQSPSRQLEVTTIPANASCAVGEAECEPAARAIISYRHGDTLSFLRTVRLVNPQAPGQVLVTDDGERLLTVNDYASAGFGENVLVVYDATGSVIARYALGDFLPQDYIDGLPRTASTLRWWGQEPRIIAGTRQAVISVLRVAPAGDVPPVAMARGYDLVLDLDTGEIERPSGAEWDHALNCARANAWLGQGDAAAQQREEFARLCQ